MKSMAQTSILTMLAVLSLCLAWKAVAKPLGEEDKAWTPPDDWSGYIEYQPGTINLVLVSPHGGQQKPEDIPDRPLAGCYVDGACVFRPGCGDQDSSKCKATIEPDDHTLDLTHRVHSAIFELTGHHPHLVVNHMSRKKMDPNREINQAAFGHPAAEKVWTEYHGSVNQSKASFDGPGLVLDMHGQSHKIVRTEFGYMISGNDLDANNLDPDKSTIRALADRVDVSFEDLLRGKDSSIGGLLEQEEGFAAVPSPQYPGPGGKPYWDGGFTVSTHGSLHGGLVDAIMVESARPYRTEEKRPIYAKALARAIVAFMDKYYIDEDFPYDEEHSDE